jgi:hypothetical protein
MDCKWTVDLRSNCRCAATETVLRTNLSVEENAIDTSTAFASCLTTDDNPELLTN